MITVTLPDGKKIEAKKGTTSLEIAKGIGRRLAEDAIVAKINGKLTDLAEPLESSCTFQILTFKDAEGKDVYWHSASHLMAQAVKRLFKGDVKLTLGPPIEEGFYYDMERSTPFTPDDLAAIEKEMEKIVKENVKAEHIWMSKKEAVEHYKKEANQYKLEIIADIPDEKISFYRQAEFVDMCRGPHVASTGCFKAFKLTQVAGAYWRGDSKNAMLQRIYGVAYPDKKILADYLKRLEEAEKRDHRRLGKELGLYMMHEFSPGSPFFLPKGAIVYNALLAFLREEYKKRGYQEVITPLLYEKTLWETSGHWEHFRKNMFELKVEDRDFSLKPMNCPSHLLIYKSTSHSYRDLPVRIADFAPLHRNEPTGTLTGLTRVRKMSQDDAHIICAPEQLKHELLALIDFAKYLYDDVFKFEYAVELSTRPEKRMGEESLWDEAEKALVEALKARGIDFEIKPGEGAFYGPKIDMHIKDAIGRKWQCATIQIDFQMPQRFGATYEGADGRKHTPVMLHRALLGSLERFMGVLIEHYAGAFPVWLAPVQIALLPVNDGHIPFAKQLAAKMQKAGLRVEVDENANTINYKIRDAQMQKVPYMLVIGDKEKETGTVQVRTRKGDISNEPLDAFIARIAREVADKS
jgi:threonyl-tRNA synthetase